MLTSFSTSLTRRPCSGHLLCNLPVAMVRTLTLFRHGAAAAAAGAAESIVLHVMWLKSHSTCIQCKMHGAV